MSSESTFAPSFVPRNNCKTELCMWEKEGVGTRKNHLQSALFMVKRVNFYLLFFLFFLADRKKKQ